MIEPGEQFEIVFRGGHIDGAKATVGSLSEFIVVPVPRKARWFPEGVEPEDILSMSQVRYRLAERHNGLVKRPPGIPVVYELDQNWGAAKSER